MAEKKPGFLKRIFSFGRKKEVEPPVEGEGVVESELVEAPVEEKVVEEAAAEAIIPPEPEPEPEPEPCLLYTSPSPRDQRGSRMPSSA